MFRTSRGPSSGSHKLLLTEVTGFVSVLAYFCVRRQCLAAYPDHWCVSIVSVKSR
jgi:hypothetical protein